MVPTLQHEPYRALVEREANEIRRFRVWAWIDAARMALSGWCIGPYVEDE
ncbi:MAG: hypothetical protein U0235_02765 [Polyangiaceae bacterium]